MMINRSNRNDIRNIVLANSIRLLFFFVIQILTKKTVKEKHEIYESTRNFIISVGCHMSKMK